MRVLDRYIIKSILNVFFLCLLTFIFLYIVIDILSHLDELLKQRVDISTLIQYYLTYLPVMFIQVAPFSCLISTLYTFAKLNRNNEIIAMRASGITILGISKTVIIFGFVISMLVFWANDKIAPLSLAFNQKIKKQMGEEYKKIQGKENINNLSMYGLDNRLFFIDRFSPKTNTMEGIIILEQDEHQNITKKILANKGVYKNNKWVFYQSVTYEFDITGQMKNEPLYLEEEAMNFHETPEEFLTQRQRPELMTISQLKGYIWKLSHSGASGVADSLKVDLYHRYLSPFLSIIIMLLGIPFSLKIKKHATGVSSLGISIILAFLYYVLNAVGLALGKSGFLLPFLAASLSHIIVLAVSVYMIIDMS